MSYYLFFHSDSPDGPTVRLSPIAGASLEEAIQNFKKSVVEKVTEYADKHDYIGQIKHLKGSEEDVQDVQFLKVDEVGHFDYYGFMSSFIKELEIKASTQVEDEERLHYEKLKAKFGAN